MNSSLQKQIQSVTEKALDGRTSETELLQLADRLVAMDEEPGFIHEFLRIGHLPDANKVFYNSQNRVEWFCLLVKLIEKSRFSTGQLIKQRVRLYPEKMLFQIIRGDQLDSLTYKQCWRKIRAIARSLSTLTKDTPAPVIGIFTPNSIAGALLDLACLSYNFRVVPIPANISEEHLFYILKHAGISHLFIGGNTPHSLLNRILPRVISTSLSVAQLPGSEKLPIQSIGWIDFLALGDKSEQKLLDRKFDSIEMNELATIMYTSGTTSDPKGIIFTQTNMITKRFARALALPDFTNQEVFLCFLPLYHTFGRFLEMMGAVFWGATYTFTESQAFNALLKDFQLVKPTVFISIPKRWIQLYEYINSTNEQENVSHKLKEITGGNLKWGLSAAGFLDPDIFQFFHRNGINLLSGYGMTEATGGITMTPPDDYQPNSVGKPLPGIEARLEDDGELMLRGAYVSPGYYGETDRDTRPTEWFGTGDIFKQKHGHFYIIDRKKEIYKNSRGQTISPQRIENLFQDFEAVKSVFIIGDGREYNTLLIYPDYHNPVVNLEKISSTGMREYFSSLVQSVNSFLAPYERIVNFTIIDRDFSDAAGELTPKSTYRRKTILKNFSSVIEPLYEKNYLSLFHDNSEVRIPNWFLREKSVVKSDIRWDGKKITVKNSNSYLPLQWDQSTGVIGDFTYSTQTEILDFQSFLLCPDLWLGNQAFIKFIGDIVFRESKYESLDDLRLNAAMLGFNRLDPAKQNVEELARYNRNKEVSLSSLHNAAQLLFSTHESHISMALNHLNRGLEEREKYHSGIAFNILMRMRRHPINAHRIEMLEMILSHLTGDLLVEILCETFLHYQTITPDASFNFKEELLEDTHFEALRHYLGKIRQSPEKINTGQLPLILFLLSVLANYGIRHPVRYIWSRLELFWWQMADVSKQIISATQKEYYRLINGFRSWLGPNETLAIDRDNGEEYTWEDVILFDTNVDHKMQSKLLAAISKTALLREAIFLFSKRRRIQLSDIQHKGVWISFLGRNYGKSVVRVLVQTRDGEAYNFVININEELNKDFIQDEIRWLVITGASVHGIKLVEDFGGYWPEYDVYTEEYVPGVTLHHYLERKQSEIAGEIALDRWQMRWLHFIWNGLTAYIDFWRRSGFKLKIANPSPANLIIPEYDYATGTRLISITDRVPTVSVSELLFDLFERFIDATERQYSGLKRMADWEVIFTVLLQTISVKTGLLILQTFVDEMNDKLIKDRAKALSLTKKRIRQFINEINENGVLTKQVVFAALRYERWLELNPEATISAKGSILQELYNDYNLHSLLDDYPETRIRFFLMTCFKNVNSELIDKLAVLQKEVRARTVLPEDLETHLQDIHDSLELNKSEKYFLTRLLYEHLDAAEYGELISLDTGAKAHLDLISLTTDLVGNKYRMRAPFHPKEIARFHSLLTEVNLYGTFQQQHEFLLLISMKNQIMGGVYWKKTGFKTAYLEKIVIRLQHQKQQLGIKLANELFNRLRNRRYKYITVGFFQTEFFYKLGFKIDKKHGGLVKYL